MGVGLWIFMVMFLLSTPLQSWFEMLIAHDTICSGLDADCTDLDWWNDGEPNDGSNSEDCGKIQTDSSTSIYNMLNDYPCDEDHHTYSVDSKDYPFYFFCDDPTEAPSSPSISTFGLQTSDNDVAGSASTNILVALWVEDLLYQCSYDGMSGDTTYTCSDDDWTVMDSACAGNTDYILVIENSVSTDAIVFESVFMEIEETTYTIDAWCIPDGSEPVYVYSTNQDWTYSPDSCQSDYTAWDHTCVDADDDDCGPKRIMLYFDTSVQTSYDALWKDATDICFDTESDGCSCPTSSPTNDPIQSSGSDFVLGTSLVTGGDAEEWCLSNYGRHLASIHSISQQSAAYDVCNVTECWIGLNCQDGAHGDWEWTDGSDWNYSNWNNGFPDDAGGIEDCVHLSMDVSGLWNDLNCDSNRMHPLCGKKCVPLTKVVPTNDPTSDPTTTSAINPTADPTYTNQTTEPTSDPTTEPTQCVDYNIIYKSSDGIDVVRSGMLQSIPSASAHSNHNQSMIIYGANQTLADSYISCNRTVAAICFIECVSKTSCLLTIVSPEKDIELEEMVIVCSASSSCKGMNVNITESSVKSAQIFCDDSNSCRAMKISFAPMQSSSVTVHCNQTRSCEDMTIHLKGQNLSDSTSAHIACYDDNSCDGLTIATDHSKKIEITLNVTRWSEHISIYHLYAENVNVLCGSTDDHRYIRYETNALLDDDDLLDIARKEYSSNRLPCEDITIHCSNNSDFDHHCSYEYDLNIDFESILNDSHSAECYWLDLGEVYLAHCHGTCGGAMVYNEYPISFDLDLIFEGGNEYNNSNQTVSYLICDEYFGTTNDTASSLQSIDVLFKYALDLIAGHNPIIHSVSFGPETSLRGDFEVQCTNSGINVIEISTYLTVKSAESDDTAIKDIFAEDGEFMTFSSVLLSEFFNVPVAFDIPSQTIITEFCIENFCLIEREAYVVLGGLSVVPILIFLSLWLCYRWRRIANAMIMNHPMVIMVAIGEYDDEKKYRNLTICLMKDIENVVHLFGHRMNYDVYPYYDLNAPNEIKMRDRWTEREIKDLLKEKSDELTNNLDAYDGLVVIYSGHGKDDSIITSDGKLISKQHIYQYFTFSRDKVAVRSIPRLFVFDCCDGQYAPDQFCESIVQLNGSQNGMKPDIVAQGSNDNHMKVEWKGPWPDKEHNPDHNLVVIHAANRGFQAFSKKGFGSYLIYFLMKSLTNSLNQKCRRRLCGPRYLGEIVNEIQSVLEDADRQLVVPVYLNETERTQSSQCLISRHVK